MIIKDGVKLCCGNCKHADIVKTTSICGAIQFDDTKVATLTDPGALITELYFYCSLHEIKDDNAS